MTSGKPDIAILGGTGDLGSGLAYQLARAGYKITIGSRSADKAHRVAQALLEDAPGTCIEAAANPEAAAGAEVVIMTVPFASHDQIIDSVIDSVQGKNIRRYHGAARAAKSDAGSIASRRICGEGGAGTPRRRCSSSVCVSEHVVLPGP